MSEGKTRGGDEVRKKRSEENVIEEGEGEGGEEMRPHVRSRSQFTQTLLGKASVTSTANTTSQYKLI